MINHSAKETWQQKEKRWDRRQHKWGGLHRIRGLAPLYQLCKETLKISHPHYKTITPPPPFPLHLHSWLPPVLVKNFHPPITGIFENFHPPALWRGRGDGTKLFGLNKFLWKPWKNVFSDDFTYAFLPLEYVSSKLGCESKGFIRPFQERITLHMVLFMWNL